MQLYFIYKSPKPTCCTTLFFIGQFSYMFRPQRRESSMTYAAYIIEDSMKMAINSGRKMLEN